jgi:hypothetical protein
VFQKNNKKYFSLKHRFLNFLTKFKQKNSEKLQKYGQKFSIIFYKNLLYKSYFFNTRIKKSSDLIGRELFLPKTGLNLHFWQN